MELALQGFTTHYKESYKTNRKFLAVKLTEVSSLKFKFSEKGKKPKKIGKKKKNN